MMPSFSNLLANRCLVWNLSGRLGGLPKERIPIPSLRARLEVSDKILNQKGNSYASPNICQAILQIEADFESLITSSQIENGKLTCWLEDEFRNSTQQSFDVSDWIDGSRFGKSGEAISYQKLIAAQMIRHGYSIHEEIGIGFTVLDFAGQSASTNLSRCNCSSKQSPCEHMLLAKEYAAPGNRKLLKEIIGFEYVPANSGRSIN
jgi:hypothetical protein